MNTSPFIDVKTVIEKKDEFYLDFLEYLNGKININGLLERANYP